MLPLLPAICVLSGVALARVRRAGIPLVLSGIVVGLLPAGMGLLPGALANGLSRTRLPPFEWQWIVIAIACASVALALEIGRRRSDAVLFLTVALSAVLIKAKIEVLPSLDETVSPRSFYQRNATRIGGACLQGASPSQTYGLNFYANRVIPVCSEPGSKPKIIGAGNGLILLD